MAQEEFSQVLELRYLEEEGGVMKKNPTFEDFFKSFDDALYDCIDNGTEYNMTISSGARTVEIRIHEAGKARADFDEMILRAAKEARIMKKGII